MIYKAILSEGDDYTDSPPRRVVAIGTVDDLAYFTIGGYAETTGGGIVFEPEGKGEFCVNIKELLAVLGYDIVEVDES